MCSAWKHPGRGPVPFCCSPCFLTSLQFVGTLVAPVFGMVGDRIGHRGSPHRDAPCLYGGALLDHHGLAPLTDHLTPLTVTIIVTITDLAIRPSDLEVSAARCSPTSCRPEQLVRRHQRRAGTTQDSARINTASPERRPVRCAGHRLRLCGDRLPLFRCRDAHTLYRPAGKDRCHDRASGQQPRFLRLVGDLKEGIVCLPGAAWECARRCASLSSQKSHGISLSPTG